MVSKPWATNELTWELYFWTSPPAWAYVIVTFVTGREL